MYGKAQLSVVGLPLFGGPWDAVSPPSCGLKHVMDVPKLFMQSGLAGVAQSQAEHEQV